MTPRLRSTTLSLLALCGALLGGATSAAAAPGDVIVRFKPGTEAAVRADARSAAGVLREEPLPVSGMELVDPQPGTTTAEAIADLERSPDVLYAQADSRRQMAAPTVTDYYFANGTLWGLNKISAPSAWDRTRGTGVTVAVVDSGVDAAHPDLAPNMWQNGGETAGDGVDNDANGYVDDVHGWDWAGTGAYGTAGDNDPRDENKHGTHVAGTIAAAADGGGVVGVAWQAKIMPLRVLDATGGGYTSNLIKAYAYAQRNGARILNASLSGPGYERAEVDAIIAAPDVLFVVAAGNGGSDGVGDDNDLVDTNKLDAKFEESYPCEYELPNVLCVAATNSADELAPFSNYGKRTVDLAAPGVTILSTLMGGGWTTMNGTSMATPHAAGAAALVLADRPELTPWQVGRALVAGVDPIVGLTAKIASGGRLNAANALTAPVPDATLQPAAVEPGPPVAPEPVVTPTPTPTPAPTPTPSPTPAPTPANPAPTPTPAAPSAPAPAPAPAPAAPAPSPAPAPAPAPAPVAAPAASAAAVDRIAPRLTISFSSRVPLRTALAGRLRARATTSERGTIRLALVIDARSARRLRIATTIGSGAATLTRAGSASVTIRLTAKAKRALKRSRNVKVTLRGTAIDLSGNRSTAAARLTLS